MTAGYLVSKSQIDKLEEKNVPASSLEGRQPSSSEEFRRMFGGDGADEEVVTVQCPVSGDPVEKFKVRKVYFF